MPMFRSPLTGRWALFFPPIFHFLAYCGLGIFAAMIQLNLATTWSRSSLDSLY
ncbi:5855_t:CDS:1, partial [Dentiscutata heterogama]